MDTVFTETATATVTDTERWKSGISQYTVKVVFLPAEWSNVMQSQLYP